MIRIIRHILFHSGLIIVMIINGISARENSNSITKSDQQLSSTEQEKFLKKTSETLKSLKNMKVDFIQERHLSMFLDPLISRGVCYFEEPDKLRWEIYESYQSILIYNNNRLSKFDFVNGKLRKFKLGSSDIMREILKQIIFWMKGDFSKSTDIYELKIYKGKNYRLMLIPKSEELRKNINSIELLINKTTMHITEVTIQESSTDFIKILFMNEKNNTVLEDNIFDLKNPQIFKYSPPEAGSG